MNKAALAVALVAVGYLALASIVSTTILPLHHKSHLKHHQDHDGFEHEGGNLIDHKLHKIDNLLKHKHHGHDHGDEHDHHGHKGHHDHDSEHEHDFHHGHDHDHDHEHEHGHEHRPKHHHHRGKHQGGHHDHEHEHEHRPKHRHQAGKHHHHKGRYQGGHRDHEHEHQPVRQPSHHHRGKQQGGHHRQPNRHRKGGRQNGGFGGGHGAVVGGAAGAFRDQEAHRAGIENHNHIGDRKRAEGKKNFFAGEDKGFEGDVHQGHEDENSGIHKHQEINTNKVLVKDQTKAVNDVDGFNNRHADEESAHVGAHDNKFAGGSASGKIAHDQEFDNDFKAGASGEHNIEGAGVVGGAEIF